MLEPIIEKVIANEVQHRQMQIDYFKKREKVGDVVRPTVYQPKHESADADLVVIFVEPGAVHLVFRDEIAPWQQLDEQYREIRKKLFGRVHDVESVELVQGETAPPIRMEAGTTPQVRFVNNFSFFNFYETSVHWTSVETYTGSIFSDTWNHMLSGGGKWINVMRGGYRKVAAEILEGDREAAERWVPSE